MEGRLTSWLFVLYLQPVPASKKTNVLVIWGDDSRLLEYQRLQPWDDGYRTPNIDRIAKEGRAEDIPVDD